ncbi:fibronectin type-III domain-containing protein [Trichonephila clavipes]|uniref:Fibronectin type-III domain-containing protein n=1 Tax=Trichonephila clavipes TaxID=2585209 RepID=A0A8X6R7E4_TRICX|nr:fibronectin type-III domain-containing protein [Trichonephila clavipes]
MLGMLSSLPPLFPSREDLRLDGYLEYPHVAKNALNWVHEKTRLEATVRHFRTKAFQLQRKLEDTNERCELLEFCLLELENQAKSLVYADKPQTLNHLEDNIRRVIADIRPQMLENVIENWTSRLDYIRASRGSHIPEIIFKM